MACTRSPVRARLSPFVVIVLRNVIERHTASARTAAARVCERSCHLSRSLRAALRGGRTSASRRRRGESLSPRSAVRRSVGRAMLAPSSTGWRRRPGAIAGKGDRLRVDLVGHRHALTVAGREDEPWATAAPGQPNRMDDGPRRQGALASPCRPHCAPTERGARNPELILASASWIAPSRPPPAITWSLVALTTVSACSRVMSTSTAVISRLGSQTSHGSSTRTATRGDCGRASRKRRVSRKGGLAAFARNPASAAPCRNFASRRPHPKSSPNRAGAQREAATLTVETALYLASQARCSRR